MRRHVETAALFAMAAGGLFLWLWRGGATEDELGDPQLGFALVAAVVLAGGAALGYGIARWAAVLIVVAVPVPFLLAWEVVVQVSDGDVWWDRAAYGHPAMLSIALYPIAAATAIGVLLARVRRRLTRSA